MGRISLSSVLVLNHLSVPPGFMALIMFPLSVDFVVHNSTLLFKGIPHYLASWLPSYIVWFHMWNVFINSAIFLNHTNSICDWLWENPPVTHKDNYLEKRDWIIQSVISPEGLKLQACNLQHSYSYLRPIRLSYLQCIASWISRHFR